MQSAGRRARRSTPDWPGFVDALSTLREVGRSDRAEEEGPATLLRLLAQYCQLESAAVYPVEGYEQWPVRWDKASGELAVTVPAEGGYISRTFEVNFN